jgi:hypothetical protein
MPDSGGNTAAQRLQDFPAMIDIRRLERAESNADTVAIPNRKSTEEAR